jgi:hypothetical protein
MKKIFLTVALTLFGVLEFPVRSVSGERLDPLRQVICCYWRKAGAGAIVGC